jgi:hypothetical protein
MSRQKRIQQVMSAFGKKVIQQSRSNLTRKKKSSTKTLYNSLGYNLEVFKSGNFSLSFEMEEYGNFQDLGVSGTKKKYDTPFKYTNKRPPASAFGNWVVRKGLKGTRDAKGRFTSRKGLQFAIANHIFEQGIKPTHFFSRPFGIEYNRLPLDIAEAFALTQIELSNETE